LSLLVEGAGMPFTKGQLGDRRQVSYGDGNEGILIGTIAQLPLRISPPTSHRTIADDGTGVKATEGEPAETFKSFNLHRLGQLSPALRVAQLTVQI
tara:strand:- start:208 stop:495 length:288 start_codon:yes stop_codon:yes gene_type:complete